MPHYSNLEGAEVVIRKVCKYCGRPIKVSSSMTQGCGEVCRSKHREARYRVIEIGGKTFDRFDRPEESEQPAVHDSK